jgi:hypothetical protein
VLTKTDVDQLFLIAEEMPHKWAKQVLGFIEGKITDQLKAKVEKLQKEYQEKLQQAQLEKAEVEGELKTLKAVAEG